MIHKEESQNIEFKLIWKDEYLKQICDIPSPLYSEYSGGFSVSFFKKKPDTPSDTQQIQQLVKVLTGEMSRGELQIALGITNKKYFLSDFLKPALESGLIEMTIPDKPNSKYQKYRLTSKKGFLKKKNNKD